MFFFYELGYWGQPLYNCNRLWLVKIQNVTNFLRTEQFRHILWNHFKKNYIISTYNPGQQNDDIYFITILYLSILIHNN